MGSYFVRDFTPHHSPVPHTSILNFHPPPPSQVGRQKLAFSATSTLSSLLNLSNLIRQLSVHPVFLVELLNNSAKASLLSLGSWLAANCVSSSNASPSTRRHAYLWIRFSASTSASACISARPRVVRRLALFSKGFRSTPTRP